MLDLDNLDQLCRARQQRGVASATFRIRLYENVEKRKHTFVRLRIKSCVYAKTNQVIRVSEH